MIIMRVVKILERLRTIKLSTIKVKKLRDSAIIPQRASVGSAGFDLFADIEESITIHPHETVKIGSGFAFEPPEGYFGAIFCRSGLSTKQNLVMRNCVGVADEDYRGEYIVPLYNDSDYDRVIHPQDRIAQVVFIPYFTGGIERVEELSDTERGSGGFGHSGN